MDRLSEELKTDVGILPQNVAAGVDSPAFLSMAEHRKVLILCNATCGLGETCVCTAITSDDALGTAQTDLADTITLTPTIGFGYIEVDADRLADDRDFIGVNLTSGGDAVNASAIIVRARGRYKPQDNSDDVDDVAVYDE